MSKGSFELSCISCKNNVCFTFKDLSELGVISCSECGKKYGFGEENLRRQLKKFATLCLNIQESEEILGNSGVALTVGADEVVIPFKILLTRLKSTLDLNLDGQRCHVCFRIEPTAL